MEIVIRTFGLLEPVDWEDDCESEMTGMVNLWNKLVDLNEDYSTRYIMIISKDEAFAEARARYEVLKYSEAPEKEISNSKKCLAIAQKEASRRMATELRALESQRREAVKIARQNSGLWWGNYNAIVSSFESARSAAIRGGNTMRRRSVSDNGRITNTLQGGADVGALFDGSLSQVSVGPLAGAAWSAESRGERRRLQRTTLSATIFVRNGERRNVSWPMIMHRPIPSGCRIKKLTITRRRVGGRWKWAASFLCTRPAEDMCPRPVGAKVAGLDIGWRRVPAGLRVATVARMGEPPEFINFPPDLLASFVFVDELRARVRVVALQGVDLIRCADPSVYEQPFRDLLREYQSRPSKKNSDLIEFCRGAFFMEQSIAAISCELLSWRREFRKVSLWLENQQRKVVSRRNHFYQNAAIHLLERLSEIIVNDVKVGEIAARKPPVSDKSYFPYQANHYRVIAAPSELIRALKLQAAKRGINFVKRKAASPVRCPQCGSTSRKTRADALPQVCANCNTSFDQDVAASQSLLLGAKPDC